MFGNGSPAVGDTTIKHIKLWGKWQGPALRRTRTKNLNWQFYNRQRASFRFQIVTFVYISEVWRHGGKAGEEAWEPTKLAKVFNEIAHTRPEADEKPKGRLDGICQLALRFYVYLIVIRVVWISSVANIHHLVIFLPPGICECHTFRDFSFHFGQHGQHNVTCQYRFNKNFMVII